MGAREGAAGLVGYNEGTDEMRDEMEAIHIHERLEAEGYLIEQDGECWKITEPQKRKMPQQIRAVRSMREAVMWAEGCEAVRFITALNPTK